MRLFSDIPIALGFLCICLVTAGSADGATYGFVDQAGDNVTFSDITEVNTGSDPSFTLFGGVSTMTDTLDLDAFNLRAEPKSGFEFKNGRLSLTAMSNPGSQITSIKISESGFGTTLGEASINVDLGGSVTVDGVRSPTASTSFTKDSSAGDGFDSEFWERDLLFSFTPTDEVRLDLNNSLFASLGSGSLAAVEASGLLIQINTINDGTVTVSAVPEPSSCFAIACVGGLLPLRRLRRRA